MNTAIAATACRTSSMTFTAHMKADHQGLISTAMVVAIYVSAALVFLQGRF
jgi:hypothetical protein